MENTLAISLSSISKVRATKPPRILIYSAPGQGKTSLAAEFPRPVFILTEDGVPKGLTLDVIGGRQLTSYNEIIDSIRALLSEPHDFLTAVFDSASGLEKMIQAEVCSRNSWKSIEQPGYGKGYKECDYLWQEFMDGVRRLRENGMAVIITAHGDIERYDDPTGPSFSRHDVDLHKRAVAIVEREVDAILHIRQDVTITKEEAALSKGRAIGQSGELRWIYTNPSAGYVAKNRFNMPDKLPYQKGQGFAQLRPFLVPDAPPAVVEETAKLDVGKIDTTEQEKEGAETADAN